MIFGGKNCGFLWQKIPTEEDEVTQLFLSYVFILSLNVSMLIEGEQLVNSLSLFLSICSEKGSLGFRVLDLIGSPAKTRELSYRHKAERK